MLDASFVSAIIIAILGSAVVNTIVTRIFDAVDRRSRRGYLSGSLRLILLDMLERQGKEYMEQGKRFNNLSMIVLKEEIAQIGTEPYITGEDIDEFYATVDAHLD